MQSSDFCDDLRHMSMPVIHHSRIWLQISRYQKISILQMIYSYRQSSTPFRPCICVMQTREKCAWCVADGYENDV